MKRATILRWLLGVSSCVFGAKVLLAAPPGLDLSPSNTSGRNTPRYREVTVETLSQLLSEAQKNYRLIEDYTCVLVKQERVQGKLLPEQTAQMAVRTQPHSVALKYSAPAELSGQEVCYVAGKHDGKMRVKGSGLKGAIGFVTIARDDPRAMVQNRHTVDEAGIGSLLEQLIKYYSQDRSNKCQVMLSPYVFNEKACHRIEIIQPNDGKSYCYRSVLYFDKESALPLRMETYDFPTKTDPSGPLLECYSFINLKLNPGLSETIFAK